MSEVKTNKISSLASNNDITLDPDGTGNTIIASGEVGVGTTTPATYTDYVSGSNAPSVVVAGSQPSYVLADTDISGNDGTLGITKAGEDTVINNLGAGNVRISNNGSERMRIDSSGIVSIGNTIGSSFNSGANNLVVGTGSGSEGITIYGGNESNIFFADGTDIADNLRGRIEYSHLSESMLFYIDNTYAMRINDGQALLLGLNNPLFSQTIGLHTSSASGGSTAHFNRTGDGGVVRIGSDGTEEGSISVSGSTVSYNGGHLARWSQATDGNRIDGLVKGTVMTNLDQMAVWHHEDKAATYYEEGDGLPEGVSVGDEKTPFVAAHDEENEQLNCMAVSSVEGDANVAGVFVNWDDDAVFTADMNIAMTGNMVIRIAQGTTVARGDLLMSAGDGTAKPQGDDIVRSKTIAKVTSTTKSHTYDDGSYLVPCVLMAC